LNYHRAGTGPPLVLIHGIGSHWQVWKPVLDLLTPHRDVIALDLPGFGASPPPPTDTKPGIDSLIRLTIEFLDDLRLERPHVAGNSLGGWIALELAKRDRVASATALSPGGFAKGLDARFLAHSLRTTLKVTRRVAPRARGITQYRLLRRLIMGQMVANPTRVPAEDAAAAIRAAAAAPWFEATIPATVADNFKPVPTLPVPVTVAWGGRDFLLPRWQARRAARALGGTGSNLRMLTLPGCGHLCTYDDPELVARVLIEGSTVP
jgi:pimeloyl-ACP methyl ester carboxylesterase